ncbi:alanine racemase [Luteimicrobium xylanilyticum]|uniref:Alanine racemase n=1 Tax=Luteimicrobium xylanilyticum TaxID=1133546 RepID=A0A5P9Q7G2_9MICO|nr:alanine racemase [Luteimicrobium xylanilyticum]QFU97367.1 Alanine racemase [Luteimicrobium xylanilyticum]
MSTYPARAVVDLAAIRHNVRTLRERAPGAAVMAVVKADAYGHGLVPAARAALAGGATWLGVAQASEALALRAAGIGPDDARILTWLHAPGVDFVALLEADVDVSVAAPWAVDAVVGSARATGRTARVHLKVDTGLGRNGVLAEDVDSVLPALLKAEAEGTVRLVGLWSHLALADEPDHPSVRAQRVVFDDVVEHAERAGARLEVRHLANSAATLTAPALHYDLVRPGLAVYGMSPVPQLAAPRELGLVPAMTLEADLATVKRVRAGQGVSYAHLYTTTQDTALGVVPLGYADGIPRHASGGSAGPGGPLLVGHDGAARVVRIAGRVCMDQVVLDLGPDATEQAGDTVRLFGVDEPLPGGGTAPTAQDWADAAGTISYEITTRLGSRIPRVHVDTQARVSRAEDA